MRLLALKQDSWLNKKLQRISAGNATAVFLHKGRYERWPRRWEEITLLNRGRKKIQSRLYEIGHLPFREMKLQFITWYHHILQFYLNYWVMFKININNSYLSVSDLYEIHMDICVCCRLNVALNSHAETSPE